MSENPRFRDRKYVAMLYPEDPTHAACIEKLKTGGYNFAAILHDRDIWSKDDPKFNPEKHKEGEPKKAHWHVVIKFSNAVWNFPTAKDLGIAPNYLEKCSSLDGSLLYLVHEGNPDKFQYELKDVFGPLAVRLASLLADDDEGTRALTIFNLIKNSPGIVTYSEIFEKAIKGGLYGDFRRMGTGVMWLINDHNNELLRESQRNMGVKKDFDNFDDFQRGPWKEKS